MADAAIRLIRNGRLRDFMGLRSETSAPCCGRFDVIFVRLRRILPAAKWRTYRPSAVDRITVRWQVPAVRPLFRTRVHAAATRV
jgi:hypothetical protein